MLSLIEKASYTLEDFLKFPQCIFAILKLSPLEKRVSLLKIKLNTHHLRVYCAKFSKNSPSGYGEEDFFNIVNVFLLFRNYVLLVNGRDQSFEQTLIPFTQRCSVPSIVEICPVVLEKKMKMEKFTTPTTTTTSTTADNGQIMIKKLTLAFSSGELKREAQ